MTTIRILFFSITELLKPELIKREKQHIELQKACDRIVMLDCDASCDSFQKVKGFHKILDFTDRLIVQVNRKVGPVILSQFMNMLLYRESNFQESRSGQ